MADEIDNEKSPKNKESTPKQNKTAEKHSSKQVTDNSSPAADLFTAKPMPKMDAKKSHKNWFLPILTVLLIIIAILASGWSIYQQQEFSKQFSLLQTNVKTQLQGQSEAIERAHKNTQTAMLTINETQAQLNQYAIKSQQLTESLFSTQERIKALSGRQKHDWMIAEAAFLIKSAQLQLNLQKDKKTAIQLLKTADRRIIETADNNLLPVREAIAKDLSDLSLIMEPDTSGMNFSIDAMIKQIPNLEIAALHFQPIETKLAEPIVKKEGFDLREIYQQFLKDFVEIKDHSEPVKPLMKEDQRINLVNNVQLALQQSQLALVKGNQSIYRLNLDNAILWLETFFNQNEKTRAVIDQARQLQSLPVDVHYPNELNAQKALNQISQEQLYQWLNSPTSNNSLIELPGQISPSEETQP